MRNPIQDTVTLSNGIPRQTTAEEAGLFQVAAPTLNSAPAPVSLAAANNATAQYAGGNATSTAGNVFPVNVGTPVAAGAPQVAAPALPALNIKPPAANATPAGNAKDAPPANTPTAVTKAAATVTAPAAAAPGAATTAGASTAPAGNAAATAPASATNATATNAQTGAATSSQSQSLLLQFTEYLQQLGLSPQAVNQMLQAAEILNNLDPPAMQQAIGELRAQAASLATQASDAPLSTAPMVRAGVTSSPAEAPAQPGALSAASGSTTK